MIRISSNGRPVRMGTFAELRDILHYARYLGATIERKDSQGRWEVVL